MKGIRNKIMISFTLLVTAIVFAIIVVISWQSSKSLALQAKTLNIELTEQVYTVVDGHNAIALTLLDAIKKDVALHLDTVATNPATTKSIESNQEGTLRTIIQKAAKGGVVDYASGYDLKGNLVAAFPQNISQAELQQYNANFPTYQKGKMMLTAKKFDPMTPELVKHAELFTKAYDIQPKIPDASTLSISGVAIILDDFGDPIGFYVAGKILNGYTAPFESLFKAAEAASVLYQDGRAISFAGFPATIEDTASMNLTPEDREFIYKENGTRRRTLTLSQGSYLSTCTVLSESDSKPIGALCTGQSEAKIDSTRVKLIGIGKEAKQSMQTGIMIVGSISFFVFVILALLITKSIVVPLQTAVNTLGSSSNELNNASVQMASASQSLSDGAASQSASLEETAASLDEMSSMMHHSADNTDQAKTHMDKVLQTVQKTTESMTEVHNSMIGISKSSEDTSKIIKTIDEIAFQTNLLALNAAVEAARAGEAGAGFAVVAEEVRSLALRSTEAAKNTANLLEESIAKVKSGTLLVDATTADFQGVRDSIAKVAQLIAEVAVGAHEQSISIRQVTDAVQSISQITMSNTAQAEESATISQSFTDQADKLNEIVITLGQMITAEKTAQTKIASSPELKLIARG